MSCRISFETFKSSLASRCIADPISVCSATQKAVVLVAWGEVIIIDTKDFVCFNL